MLPGVSESRTSVRAAETVTCSADDAARRTISRFTVAVAGLVAAEFAAPALQGWRAVENPAPLISMVPDAEGTVGNRNRPWSSVFVVA